MGAGGNADPIDVAFIFIDDRTALVNFDGVLRADLDTLSRSLAFAGVNLDSHGVWSPLYLMASQKLTNCCVAAIALAASTYLSTHHCSTIARLAFGAFCLAIDIDAFLRKHHSLSHLSS
jgi:hypothetical protein